MIVRIIKKVLNDDSSNYKKVLNDDSSDYRKSWMTIVRIIESNNNDLSSLSL